KAGRCSEDGWEEQAARHKDREYDGGNCWPLQMVAAAVGRRVQAEVTQEAELAVGEQRAASGRLVSDEDGAVALAGHVELDASLGQRALRAPALTRRRGRLIPGRHIARCSWRGASRARRGDSSLFERPRRPGRRGRRVW